MSRHSGSSLFGKPSVSAQHQSQSQLTEEALELEKSKQKLAFINNWMNEVQPVTAGDSVILNESQMNAADTNAVEIPQSEDSWSFRSAHTKPLRDAGTSSESSLEERLLQQDGDGVQSESDSSACCHCW